MASSSLPCGETITAHVLFVDIVEYSLQPMDVQERLVTELQDRLRRTQAFREAEKKSGFLRLPTGDGAALVFLHDPVAPVQCAIELARMIASEDGLRLRTGIHSGPAKQVRDIKGALNLAGPAINLAERVMSSGDAGHILLSGTAVDLLAQAGQWIGDLHDLGVHKTKHGNKLRLYSLHGEDFGNAEIPSQLAPVEGESVAVADPGGTESEDPVAPVSIPVREIGPPGGALPPDSRFYVRRPADQALAEAVRRRDSIILIKGARQVGKSSLLARGLEQARRTNAKVILTDFQKLSRSDLESVDRFYGALAEELADQLDLAKVPSDSWVARHGSQKNFDNYLFYEALADSKMPLFWGMDEVDRLFDCPFADEVFGLFRSWHNSRALEPKGPSSLLTLLIGYATEPHLFIKNPNQSPFNVGTRLALRDFTLDEVGDLNERHGGPLRRREELERFYGLVGGQPFLVQSGLRELAAGRIDLAGFEVESVLDDGLFGDHLRRILVLLDQAEHLRKIVCDVLRGKPCLDREGFFSLRSAGILAGNSMAEARLRCRLYAIYLQKHLL